MGREVFRGYRVDVAVVQMREEWLSPGRRCMDVGIVGIWVCWEGLRGWGLGFGAFCTAGLGWGLGGGVGREEDSGV